jgi:hypothetical protein
MAVAPSGATFPVSYCPEADVLFGFFRGSFAVAGRPDQAPSGGKLGIHNSKWEERLGGFPGSEFATLVEPHGEPVAPH